MNKPEITVVIPTRHRNEELALCLECLAPGVQSLPFERYEVIVTDDGIASNAQSMIRDRFPWVHWVEGPRRGPASNRNRGASFAKGDWIAFTDDDCLPEANWLEMFVSQSSSLEIGALEGAISATGDTTSEFTECPVNEDGGHFWTANVAVRKDVFDSIGGFDESYPMAAHEDQDLYIRLQECTSIKFVRDSVVLHPVRNVELRAYFRLLPSRARAYAIHLAKHRRESTSIKILFDLIMNRTRVIVKHIRQGKIKAVGIVVMESLISLPVTIISYSQIKGS